MIRRSPNGTTRPSERAVVRGPINNPRKRTQGSETSQYLQEKTSNEMAQVVASERAGA